MKVAERGAGIAQPSNLTLNEDNRRIAEFSSVRFIRKYSRAGDLSVEAIRALQAKCESGRALRHG